MPKTNLLTTEGKTIAKIELPKEIFDIKFSPQSLAQAVRVYLSNRRKAKAKTKTRSEVAGSGRKIYRQKGTGHARHGDMYAPLFVGGGVTHGPKGNENYRRKINKRVKKLTLSAALTAKFRNNEIRVIEGLNKVEPKAKAVLKIIKNLFPQTKEKKVRFKMSIISEKFSDNLKRAARNIQGLRLLNLNSLNAYEILNGGKILIVRDAVEKLEEQFKLTGKKK